MKTSRDFLSEVLRHWRVTPPADPNFRGAVWQRIDACVRETWPGYLRSHAVACALVAVSTVGAAAYAGNAAARARIHADREALVTTYLVELDPRVQALLKP